MSVDKPEEIPNWATDHAIEDDLTDAGGDPNRVVRPSGQHTAQGWEKTNPAIHSIFNYLSKLTGLWIAWLVHHGESHIHDGGSADLSAPKVDLTSHVDYGEAGQLSVTTDIVDDSHHIDHAGNGPAVAQFRSDILRAEDYLLSDKVRTLSGSEFTVEASGGSVGSATLTVGALKTDAVEMISGGTSFNIRGPGGTDDVALDVNSLTVDSINPKDDATDVGGDLNLGANTILANKYRPSGGSTIEFEGSGGGPATINFTTGEAARFRPLGGDTIYFDSGSTQDGQGVLGARNVPKIVARISSDGTTITGEGSGLIDSVTYTNDQYYVEFTTARSGLRLSATIAGVAEPPSQGESDAVGIRVGLATVAGGAHGLVEIVDSSNTATQSAFFLTAYWDE